MERQSHMRSADTQPDATNRPHLNETAVVDRLIRDFTRTALDAVGRADFMAYLDFECRRMNSLFLGGPAPAERYERAQWNTPDQLGEHLLKALQITGETRLAVRDAFMVYFSRALDLAKDCGRFNDAALEPLIDDLSRALVGQFASRS
ncbi:hypothetical protein OKW45_003740 [Paraburkholderia sp. WSM4175]|uniref:hypothetical protein n=1 Tax=Paraburkholderia sp. WSM4175 TaxID=2991072 RepID=UPI003D1D2CEE